MLTLSGDLSTAFHGFVAPRRAASDFSRAPRPRSLSSLRWGFTELDATSSHHKILSPGAVVTIEGASAEFRRGVLRRVAVVNAQQGYAVGYCTPAQTEHESYAALLAAAIGLPPRLLLSPVAGQDINPALHLGEGEIRGHIAIHQGDAVVTATSSELGHASGYGLRVFEDRCEPALDLFLCELDCHDPLRFLSGDPSDRQYSLMQQLGELKDWAEQQGAVVIVALPQTGVGPVLRSVPSEVIAARFLLEALPEASCAQCMATVLERNTDRIDSSVEWHEQFDEWGRANIFLQANNCAKDILPGHSSHDSGNQDKPEGARMAKPTAPESETVVPKPVPEEQNTALIQAAFEEDRVAWMVEALDVSGLIERKCREEIRGNYRARLEDLGLWEAASTLFGDLGLQSSLGLLEVKVLSCDVYYDDHGFLELSVSVRFALADARRSLSVITNALVTASEDNLHGSMDVIGLFM